MDFQFNCNQYVKVKLTTHGINILSAQQHELSESVIARGGTGLGPFVLRLDENGYYCTQMWMLMERFGEHMGITSKQPFDLDILLVDGKPLEATQ